MPFWLMDVGFGFLDPKLALEYGFITNDPMYPHYMIHLKYNVYIVGLAVHEICD